MLTQDDIYLAKICYFTLENGLIYQIFPNKDEEYVICTVYNNKIIDLEHLNTIECIKYDKNGYIENNIYENTYYITESMKLEKCNKSLLNKINLIFDHYLEIQDLVEDKKIIKFPQRSLK